MCISWLRRAVLVGVVLFGAIGSAEAISITSLTPCFDQAGGGLVGPCPVADRPLVVGTETGRMPVTVLNDEGAAITITPAPTAAAPFLLCAAPNGACVAPDFTTSIANGATFTFYVAYAPVTAGVHTQALDLNTSLGGFASVTAQGTAHFLDIVMLFDNSGSMQWTPEGVDPGNPPLSGNARLSHARSAASNFLLLLSGVPGLATGVHAGVCRFNYAPAAPNSAEACDAVTAPPSDIAAFDFGDMNTAVNNVSIVWDGTQMGRGLQAALNRVTKGAAACPANHKCVIVMLSNGAHNQGVAPEGVLAGSEVKLFAVGYGNTGDVDPVRLSNLVVASGNTATAGVRHFDPKACPAAVPVERCVHTQKDLKGFFASMLQSLGLVQVASDPQSTILSGQTQTFDVAVVELDRTAQFLITWEVSPQTFVSFDLLDPQGTVVNPATARTDDNVQFLTGSGFMLYRIREGYLRRPNKVGVWKMRISYGSAPPRLSAVSTNAGPFTYHYGAFMVSGLELHTAFDRPGYATGDPMTVTAFVTANGVKLAGPSITSIKLVLERPDQGIGSWFGAHRADPQLIGSIPAVRAGEPLTGAQRKGLAVRLTAGIDPPSPVPLPEVSFNDDGMNGDALAGDGVYTARFTDTSKPDTYNFQIVALGRTTGGFTFRREALVQQILDVNVIANPATSPLTFQIVTATGRTTQVRVAVVPTDPFKNLFGPGHINQVDFQTTTGTWITPIEDDLEGGYSRVLEISGGQNPDVTVSVGGKTFPTTNVNSAVRPNLEIGLFAGRFFIDHDLSINDGPVFGVRVGKPLVHHLTVEGELGITTTSDFAGNTGRAIQVLGSLRWDANAFGAVTPFLTAGVGVLNFTGFPTTDSGALLQFGGGVLFPVNSRTRIRLDAREMFGFDTFGTNSDNFQVTAGVVIGF